MGCSKSTSKREVYSNTSYLTKQEKHQIDNLTLYLKQQQKIAKISRRKEIIKIQAEINEKEMKETIAKINKTKIWFFEKTKLIKLQPDSSKKKKREREKTQINKIRNEKGEVTMTMQKCKDYKRLL